MTDDNRMLEEDTAYLTDLTHPKRGIATLMSVRLSQTSAFSLVAHCVNYSADIILLYVINGGLEFSASVPGLTRDPVRRVILLTR